MYEAMKLAAQKNPKFAEELQQAEENRRRKNQEEAAMQRARARAAYEAKVEKEKKEAEAEAKRLEEQEKQRREKEVQILSTLLPFGYCYPFMGEYSASYGIQFANSIEEATELVAKSLDNAYNNIPNPGEFEKEHFEFAKSHLHVWPLDLSTGACSIGEYYE